MLSSFYLACLLCITTIAGAVDTDTMYSRFVKG